MADFSQDRAGMASPGAAPHHMPARFPEKKPAQPSLGRRGQGQPLGRPGPQRQAQMEPIGHPQPQPQDSSQPQDLAHYEMALQHQNIRDLGRDVPFAVWSTLNGAYRRYFQPGRPPFDYLEDAS